MTHGFSYWKDTTICFQNHEKSACHSEAVEVMVTATTRNIGELLSVQHAEQKDKNQQALYQIVSSIRFLSRQELAMRGDKDEADGNHKQLLHMKSEEDLNLAECLKRKENVYISPDIQNEILKTMGLQISRKLPADIQASLFITIMVNETTDVSNSEQVTLAVIKDVLIRMNVSFSKLRGQCYDSASAMCCSKSVVAKCISDLESRAVFTHCYGHTLNLAASDTLKQCKLTKDALDMTHEITKLIKYSPQREAIFRSFKDTLPSSSTLGVRVLCPTGWTVRADSLLSIVSNYEALQSTWDKAVTIAKDTETKARIHGVSF